VGVRGAAILESLIALLPPGAALRKDSASNLAALLGVTADSLERLEELAEFVAEDLDPRVTTLFLEDWERVLGLPECGGLAETTAERRAAVVEKATRVGSLAAGDLMSAAAVLGFTITLREFRPFAPDLDGSPVADAHTFEVVLPELEVAYFRVGESRSGDSLGSFGDARLVCLLDARKPAHTNYRLVSA